jgi:hypothetical protein
MHESGGELGAQAQGGIRGINKGTSSYERVGSRVRLTNAQLEHTLEYGGKSLVLPNRLLYRLMMAPGREMMRLDADPGGSSRVRPVINVFLYGMQRLSCMSPGEGSS